MTNKEMLDIAMMQSAIDLNCQKDDFLLSENKIVLSKASDRARKYLTLPFDINMVSYGTNIVASIKPEFKEIVTEYMSKYPIEHCFETPNMYALNQKLSKYNVQVCFMAEYFLADVNVLKSLSCPYEMRMMGPEDFANLYKPEWGNALCEKRKELDVLGIGAYDKGKLVGLAACSADGEEMWQIGIDVLPEYRKLGIASALTSRLALEIIARGKVPFYCAAWCNIKSVRNAIKSGFRPAWAEMTVKSNSVIQEFL